MSRRRRRTDADLGAGGTGTSRRGPSADADSPAERAGSARGGIARDVLILAVVFGVAVGLAELFGAANLGVSFGIGQLAFAGALVAVLTRD